MVRHLVSILSASPSLSHENDLLINGILFYIIFDLNIKAEECQGTSASDKKVLLLKKSRFADDVIVSVFKNHQHPNQNGLYGESTLFMHHRCWLVFASLIFHMRQSYGTGTRRPISQQARGARATAVRSKAVETLDSQETRLPLTLIDVL